MRSYTAEEIAEAASRAGLVLYTEAGARAALEVAAKTAVEKAVPDAVNIALADYAKAHRAETWIAWGVAAIAVVFAVFK